MPRLSPTEQIDAFLKASGWNRTKLAAAVHRTDSAIAKVLAGERELTVSLAIDLQIATVAALAGGTLPRGVKPLRAADLHEKARALLKAERAPRNKAEAHRLAHKLRDPKFYTARTKRAVNSLTVERGPKVGAE